MDDLKKIMLVFRFEPDFNRQPSEEEQSSMHQKWGEWIGGIASQAKLVSTHQLGFEAKQILADGSVNDKLYMGDGKIIGGNMVVRATSQNEAVELAKGCPILEMGGCVEIRDIIPMDS